MAASPIECGAALGGPSGTFFLSTWVTGHPSELGRAERRAGDLGVTAELLPPPTHTPSLNVTLAPERWASEAGLIREARLVCFAFLGNCKARFLQ